MFVMNQTQFLYNTSQKKLTFTDMHGRLFEYWTQSNLPPKLNRRVFNFDPPKTYSSPYVSNNQNTNTVDLQIGAETLTLDFN